MRRLTLLVAAPTAAARHAAFPALDEPIEPAAIAALDAVGTADRWRPWRAVVAPERRARDTAIALGLDAAVDADLADIDMGGWRGRGLDDIQATDPGLVADWLEDPATAPPNGESVRAARDRVGRWLTRLGADADDRPLLAVTHTAVARLVVLAVLDAPVGAFRSIDAPALTASELSHDGTRWALRSHGLRLDAAAP